MSMVIKCECGYQARGETEDELIANADRHVGESHPELAGKVSREDFLAMAEEE